MNPWPWKILILFSAIVLLPALMIGISNFSVFPDSSLLATLMLVVTVMVAGIFTWQATKATPKIVRYCIIAHIVICAILCVNLGGHWILAREISAAKQGVEERHVEEDREENRKANDVERRLRLAEAEAKAAEANEKLAAAQTRAANAERRRLASLPFEQRRSALGSVEAKPELKVEPIPSVSPLALVPVATATVAVAAVSAKPKLTPDQVRERWWWFLTALAIAECAASVLAGAILGGVWEWDRNRDGIADHLQNRQAVTTSHTHADGHSHPATKAADRAIAEGRLTPPDPVGKSPSYRM